MIASVPWVIGCSDDDSGSKTGASESGDHDHDKGVDEDKDTDKDTDQEANKLPAEQDSIPSTNEGGTEPKDALPEDLTLPIVFVHGFAGSAQQFDSQAQRYIVNGYPAERLYAYEHDGAGFDTASFISGLDEVVNKQREKFKTDKVYLIGHSRGTLVSSTYLSDPARAEKVAKYISLDGGGCANIPIPCKAPAQTTNTRGTQTDPIPDQKHVEVATSKESFKIQFKFLFDKDPEVIDIVKQRAQVKISGRAVNFPANTGLDGSHLDVWAVDGETGLRTKSKALASFDLGAEGTWGPVTVNPDKYYEFVLSSSSNDNKHHFYSQRFLRSTEFVRLLSGPIDSDARVNSNVSDSHTNLIVSRMREWGTSDVLEVGTKSKSGDGDARNVISEATRTDRIAIYLQDDAATPKETTLELLPWYPDQAFQTGVDIYLPGNETPDGTITLTNQPRGDKGKTQVIHVPNWASDKNTISVMFADFPQP